jgi:exopolysaccharide biosynthesis polyprenyl glycosylphosphotransferase
VSDVTTSSGVVPGLGEWGPAREARGAAGGLSGTEHPIPRLFMWGLDALVLALAFAVAQYAAPLLHELVVAAGAADLLPWLSVSAGPHDPAQFSAGRNAWLPLVMLPVTLVTLDVLGGHRPVLALTRARIVAASAGASLAGASFLALIMFTLRHENATRSLVAGFVLFSGGGFASWRLLLRSYRMRRLRAGAYARSVVVIGPQPETEWIHRYFRTGVPPEQYRLTGHLDVPGPGASPGRIEGLERLGSVMDLGHLLIHRPIHEVIVVQANGDAPWLNYVLETCDYFRITVRIVPASLLREELRDLRIRYRSAALRLPEVVLAPRHLDSEALFVKRLMDIVVSGVALVALSPLFALIALTIKITTPKLPVFYPWRVVGFKGQPFTGYKFTTMAADADERKAGLMHLNEMSGPVFKIKHDPRVTPLGRLLRKYSLNELPQLWSVLKGEMSLVGPRPAFPHELQRFELWHKRKLSVRPGLTCLWQVRGRNAVSDFDDWVRMDLEYIDRWSLWLDLRILVRTAWAVVAGTGS